ncbi:transposon Ty3-I Gag-Pol polyprotein [Trichonephila clavata]|uniref:Transposon Ty3-I Gag-Pol polyprotein n=1 Tax=Trichonephila clavata TaxID=2740835 RepID=A0A8X6M334_TRICU|nr:transposon Ty3-I Gag-Pol polyprotein [Trichonephila clavata]
MKITPITTHPFDKDHPVQLEEDHQHAVQGPITDAIPNFQPVAKSRGKLSRSPSIGGEVANFRNPPLAAKLHGIPTDVFIDNQPVKALVDSGASNSIISETYRRKQRKVMFLDTKPVILKVADGNYVKSLGKCVLQLTINGRTQPFQFTVLPKCSHNVILGFDFLKASQAILDCGRAELIFDELLHDEEIDSHGIKLYAMSDSVVPARSCKFLTVQARDAQDDTDFLVEGNKVMCINQGIAVPSMITSLRKGKASIWVTNCENQARCIPKGMCIANAEPARSECLNTLTEVPSYTDLWTSKCSDQIDYSRMMASTLSVEQKKQMKSLLRQFQDAFHSETQQRERMQAKCETQN